MPGENGKEAYKITEQEEEEKRLTFLTPFLGDIMRI